LLTPSTSARRSTSTLVASSGGCDRPSSTPSSSALPAIRALCCMWVGSIGVW
jgi:hypothetical protein